MRACVAGRLPGCCDARGVDARVAAAWLGPPGRRVGHRHRRDWADDRMARLVLGDDHVVFLDALSTVLSQQRARGRRGGPQRR